MYKSRKILAVIPARGSSRGLPRKNVQPLLGKPLIAQTIEQAKNSKYIDRFLVSTDDGEIAEISKRCGAEVPFMRPKELATDEAKGIDVILHAVNFLKKRDQLYEMLLVLQPTSPLRISKDIDNAIELLSEKDAQAVVSVCKTEHHPGWANMLPPDGCMKDFIKPEHANKNRQELPDFYRLNGAVYVAYVDYISEHRSFFGDKTFAYVMPQERSVDIDTETDLKLADFLLKLHR